jgi:glycosyltransferase involved in cell wall biosynthesis
LTRRKTPTRTVAFVLPSLNSGGAERAALNLAANTVRSRCIVVAESGCGDLASDPLARETVVVSSGRRRNYGRAVRVQQLAQTLRRVRPDLVVSMLSPFVTTAAGTAAGAPVLHWVQAPWSETTPVGGQGLVAALHRIMLRAVARRSRLFAAATPGLLEECRELGISPTKLVLLPNGLVLPPFPPRAPDRTRSRIVSVGRLEPQKRQDLLLEAVASISRERTVELVLVGTGARERQLREQAQTLGIAERVTFTGFVPDPSHHIAAADVFALATDHEGFGNVIVEALACGVPTVVSDVPYGPQFILCSTRIGQLVEPGSSSALAKALRLALDRPPSESERADARRRAEDFRIDRVAARFEQLVDRVLDGKRDTPTPALTSWP